jgi:hypothetical protein
MMMGDADGKRGGDGDSEDGKVGVRVAGASLGSKTEAGHMSLNLGMQHHSLLHAWQWLGHRYSVCIPLRLPVQVAGAGGGEGDEKGSVASSSHQSGAGPEDTTDYRRGAVSDEGPGSGQQAFNHCKEACMIFLPAGWLSTAYCIV